MFFFVLSNALFKYYAFFLYIFQWLNTVKSGGSPVSGPNFMFLKVRTLIGPLIKLQLPLGTKKIWSLLLICVTS